MKDIEIVIDDEVKDVGLADLMCSLIKDNCAQNDTKRNIFLSLNGEVLITATDAEVTILLSFKNGKLHINNGSNQSPNLRIRATSDRIIGLSNIGLFMGYPNLLNRSGFEILRALFKREIVIEGIMNNLIFGINLLRLISVN